MTISTTESKDYIIIALSDFPYSLLAKTPEMKFRSLEKYLEKNAISFDFQWDKVYIFVKDEFEARQIGTDFRLKKLSYYINGKVINLSLAPTKPIRQSRQKKKEKKEHDEVTLTELRTKVREEKIEDGKPLSFLINRKILTQEEFKKGVKDWVFHPFVVGHKKYISNSEIQTFLHQ